MVNEALPKLLRAIAGSEHARQWGHDIVLNAAADEIDRLRAEATITIEGERLTDSQVMAVRVAIASFLGTLKTGVMEDAYLDDAYRQRLLEVLAIMNRAERK